MSDTNNQTVWLGNAIHARALDGKWGGGGTGTREPPTGEYYVVDGPVGTLFFWQETYPTSKTKIISIYFGSTWFHVSGTVDMDATEYIHTDGWTYYRGTYGMFDPIEEDGSTFYGIYRSQT